VSFFLLIALLAWAFALAFTSWHLWKAPEAYEDDEGFHLPPRSKARWHHVRVHHPL